jgi:sigma-E factor negative regulatory protein RseA
MEKISALMDGELDGQQAHQQIQRLKDNEELARCWDTFHLIGDAMRNERALSQAFGQRVTSRISAEPTVLAPRRTTTVKRAATYALSAAASLSAVALVGWVALSAVPPAPQADIAKAPIPPIPAVPASATPSPSATPTLASVPSDGTMNEYLMAHQEFSPSTALQGVAPYIRSVSITQQAQGR